MGLTSTTTIPPLSTTDSYVKIIPAAPSSTIQYWWQKTGEPLDHLLTWAEYSEQVKNRYLDFYYSSICRSLGETPSITRNIRGCLTADGTPVEYSISFNGSMHEPTIRLSVDPDATSLDILSTKRTNDLAQSLPLVIDGLAMADISTWYADLCDHFSLPKEAVIDPERLVQLAGHRSQIMLGFDLSRDLKAAKAKAYFLPCIMAALTGRTRWSIVREGVMRLISVSEPHLGQSLRNQLHKLDEHVSCYSKQLEDGVRYLAIDLVRPEEARAKVYVRCPSRDFDGTWRFFTLNDQIEYQPLHKMAIRELYSIAKGQDHTISTGGPCDITSFSPFNKTDTLYFELKNNCDTPQSKIFLQVNAPSLATDKIIAKRLEEWFVRWGWLNEGSHWSYMQMLKSAFPEASRGVHVWIAVSKKKGKLTVEPYLAPQLFREMECGEILGQRMD